MMTTTRILVLDRNEDLAADVTSAMDGVRPTVSVDSCHDPATVTETLRDQGPYDVLLVGPTMGNRAMVGRLEGIHHEQPAMSVVLTFLRRPTATMREIVRTGACDLLQVPVDEKVLQESLLRAVELSTKLRAPTSRPAEAALPVLGGAHEPGRVFTTSSATGGCGKTFLATNLAYFFARYTGKRTCVIDLDLQFGEVTTALRLRPRYTISDALQRQEVDDGELALHIEEYLVQHESGFWVLPAPKEPAEADHISQPDVTRIIEAVRSRFDYVIVDTPAALTEIVLAAFDLSDVLFTMATLDLPSIRNMGVFLNQLERLKIPSDNIQLILNKAEKGVGIDVDQVTRLFPKQFTAVLPYAKEVSRSINVGMPVLAASPHAPVSRLMTAGLAVLLPPEAREHMPELSPSKSGFLSRVLRRGA
ncbi:MAG: AAA family ATPase [Acidimicrobiales bacterium]